MKRSARVCAWGLLALGPVGITACGSSSSASTTTTPPTGVTAPPQATASTAGTIVLVPNVVGLTFEKAQATLKDASLDATNGGAESGSAPSTEGVNGVVGVVAREAPAPGTKVAAGSVVTLIIGPPS
jgi:hypothetical protein